MILDAALGGDRVLVATQSGRVEAYDWRKGTTLEALLSLPPEPGHELPATVSCVAISPGGLRGAAASSDERLWLFDLEGSAAAALPRPLPTFGSVLACRFLDDRHLLLGSMRGELALVDIDTGKEIYRRQLDYDPIYAIASSPDRSRVAIGLRSSRIQVVDARSGRTLQMLEGHRDSVFSLGWANEGALVSGSKDKQILYWDLRVDPPSPRTLYRGDRYVTAVAIDPAGTRLAATLEDHRIGLIEMPTGRILEQLAGHTAPIQALAFTSGGNHLISAGNDARVLVWNIENPEENERP